MNTPEHPRTYMNQIILGRALILIGITGAGYTLLEDIAKAIALSAVIGGAVGLIASLRR